MILTEGTYFSAENQLKYMGSSQYKQFFACESMALAELRGEYIREATTALMVSSYVDASMSGTLDLFRAQHPEIFKRDGSLKAEYEQANSIIQRIEEDELFVLLMSGQQQVIRTGEIAGVPFKIKIDSKLDAETCREIVRRFPETSEVFGDCRGANVDMKIMRDFNPVWRETDRLKLPFVEAWGYHTQAAIYTEVDGEDLPFIIAGASKEKETDLLLLSVPTDVIASELINIEALAPYYNDLKHGIGEASRCGQCPNCRRTKKLTQIIDYREV